MMEYALEIRGLRKEYKGFTLRDVSFALPRGTIMGLVGPNGAGKTTVIKLILNLIRRQAGEVTIFGEDVIAREKEVKSRLGFVHEVPSLVEDATLRNIAEAVAPFYEKWDGALFRSLVSEFGLPPDKKFKKLSDGMKMKFSLALALSHDADLLILDEPTSGLDPVFRRELLERLSGLIQDESKAVLFSTHITSDLETTADYITFLHAGEVVFSLPKDEIQESWAVVKGGAELLNGRLRPFFRTIRQTPHYVEALTSDVRSLKNELPPGAVVEKASVEDIMVFMDEGAAHV
jgi:ABC-2 type transport system ATP-binding protein